VFDGGSNSLDCTQFGYGAVTDGGISPIILNEDLVDHQMSEWFSFQDIITNNFEYPTYVFIDHEMKVYQKNASISFTEANDIIEEMLDICV
jgi:hypothetical protein